MHKILRLRASRQRQYHRTPTKTGGDYKLRVKRPVIGVGGSSKDAYFYSAGLSCHIDSGILVLRIKSDAPDEHGAFLTLAKAALNYQPILHRTSVVPRVKEAKLISGQSCVQPTQFMLHLFHLVFPQHHRLP